MAQCEDYPCCGHTDGLGCGWVAPDFSDPATAARYHIGCDHETGYCQYEDEDEDYISEDEDDAEFHAAWRA